MQTLDPRDLNHAVSFYSLQINISNMDLIAFSKPFSCSPSSFYERMTRNKYPFSKPVVPICISEGTSHIIEFVFKL